MSRFGFGVGESGESGRFVDEGNDDPSLAGPKMQVPAERQYRSCA